MGPTDAELIARVLVDDDRHAFAQLVRRNQSMIRSLLRRLTGGDAARADDLAQETFLRAYRGLRSFRGRAKLSSWLCRIAYNVFLSDLRRRPEPLLPLEVEGGDGERPRSDLQIDLARAMRGLSPGERAAIALAYGQGATHDDVARILDLPLGTVKSHIARGKEKLRRRLRGYDERLNDA